MKEFIEGLLKTRKDVYLRDPLLILEDYRKEREKIEEYEGRQLLELLQNADDEAVTDSEKICFIHLSENRLVVANNGRKFSKDGIQSLMYSNLSPKIKEQNKIGQKGLGFRSILSWAKSITIKSYDFAVQFSPKIAQTFLDSIIKEKECIQDVLSKHTSKDDHCCIAVLRCPKVLTEIPDELKEYDTYIVVDLKDGQQEKVESQIENEIDMEMMLFLNKLEKVIVDSPKHKFTLSKSVSADKAITITKTSGEIVESKIWNINAKSGKLHDKNYDLKIAWTNDLDDKKGVLYSYFRTNVKFPFPALIHGTFDLTSDRNSFLYGNHYNESLVDELINLLIDTARKISDTEVSYKPLKLLDFNGNNGMDIFFDNVGFKSRLIEKIKNTEVKLFPTICDEYISFEEEPKFYKENFAEILPKEEFPDLLKYTTDNAIVSCLENVGAITYDEEYFIEQISKISPSLNLQQRSKLILLLTKTFEKGLNNLPALFIDQNGGVIDSQSDIFLPSTGNPIALPGKLKLKIIHTDLYGELKKLFEVSQAEVIAGRLKIFNIKPYRFGDIISQIVSGYDQSGMQICKDLISDLYELFLSNYDKRDDFSFPEKVAINLLNRNGDVKKAQELYLGVDYGETLCEELYHYDIGKFVAPPEQLGLKGKEEVQVFLRWIGVADKPREKLVEVESDYAQEVIRQFPFHIKSIYPYDPSLNSYEKLYKTGYWGCKSMASTIDDIEMILRNKKSNEIVFCWFWSDERILAKKERNEGSYVEFVISNKKYYAKIKNDNMPSYLLWKIKHIQWLDTESGLNVYPYKCCLSKTITKDFSPLIEIPKVDYSVPILKDNKIKKADVESMLEKVGVNRVISDFPIETIYTILTELPKVDPDGNKARLIYSELAENFNLEDFDEMSSPRQDFLKNGLVFCKKGNDFAYKSPREVYYVQDKIYGESIIGQFYTIAIERRKNSTVIEKILGVKTLAELKFTLSSEPVLIGELNICFHKELAILLPFIYALRMAKDTEGTQANKLREAKIELCSEIFPQYEFNSQKREFKLQNYEFVYVADRKTYYVRLNEGDCCNIRDLQNDSNFPCVVAEIFSNMLKVDSIRSNVARLFEASPAKRKSILKNEQDISDSVLIEAKKKLNAVSDNKVLFWLNVIDAKGYEIEYREYELTELESVVSEKLNIAISDMNIDYENLNDKRNAPEIIRLFKTISLDVSGYNDKAAYQINLCPYYRILISQKKNDNKNLFKQLLYNRLLLGSEEDKKSFIGKILQYEGFDAFELENSVNFDVENTLNKCVMRTFQVDLSQQIGMDCEEKSKSNYEALLKKIDSSKKSGLENFINENKEYRSLVYFGELELIIKAFTDSMNREYEVEEGKKLTVNGRKVSVKGNGLKDIYDALKVLDLNTDIENVKTEKVEETHNKKTGSGSRFGNSRKLSESRKKEIGFLGELFVFETLKKQFGDAQVSWESGYAKDAGVNLTGDDEKHFDIAYKKDGEYYYVEVKSTLSDSLEFEISNQEFEFGVSKKANYEIFIVVNVEADDKHRKIKNIGNPFIFDMETEESLTNNPRFSVLNDKFIIKMKESKKK